jgi:mannose-6-phosphate isomerase
MSVPLYPLRFHPVYEQQGATAGLLPDFLAGDQSRTLPEGATASWELVDAPDKASVIANGPLAGIPLAELVARSPREIVGRRHRPGHSFPLCIRLAEIAEPEPLAVCPEYPVRLGGETYRPNHRFWVSLAAGEQAEINVGINQNATRLDIVHSLESFDLVTLLQSYPPLPHDAFFAPSGRVFSIGAGNLVWELREHPGEPLTISRWGRGTPPPEDVVAAGLRAVYFQDRQVSRISRDASVISQTRRVPLLPHCPSFCVEEIRLFDHLYDRTNGGTFHLLAVIEGQARLECGKWRESIPCGSLACLPAALGDYRLYAEAGPARVLRVVQPTI